MKIAIIGAGNMGGAIARGLARGTKVAPSDISVSNPSQGKLVALKAEFPQMNVYSDNTQAAEGADLVIVAVKPDHVEEVLDAITFRKGTIIVSLAAGVSLSDIAYSIDEIPDIPPILDAFSLDDDALESEEHFTIEHITHNFRLMPNIAIRNAESANIFCCDPEVPQSVRDSVLEVFSELGKSFFVDEDLMDAAMAVGSCAIAYFFKMIEAATQAGVQLGLKYDIAKQMAAQACLGAAGIVLRENALPAAEISKVCSPGGYTIKGINALENHGFSRAVIAAILASAK